MEKDIDKIPKNPETDIVIRIDDFGGRVGLTIREFVRSERYTGFTKAGTRIPATHIKQFKEAIASIDEAELEQMATQAQPTEEAPAKKDDQQTLNSEDKKPENSGEEVAM